MSNSSMPSNSKESHTVFHMPNINILSYNKNNATRNHKAANGYNNHHTAVTLRMLEDKTTLEKDH